MLPLLIIFHIIGIIKKTKEIFYDYVTVGDLACRTKDGYIKLVDRKKNMIISGGRIFILLK